ncbi:MAG: FAD-linked oxidase, partial [Aurantibacter sp.]
GNIISLKDVSKRMIEELKANNIPFTIHWGKNSNWAFPGLVKHMYGDKAKEWMTYRSALLSDEMQKLFSNGFLDTVKLSKKEAPIPPDLIASLL